MPGTIISTRNMLERLVAFDTTSRESNLALIEYVRDYLDGHGVASTLIHNDARTKANLYATIGPRDAPGGIVLSGHTDVVPVDGQDWRSPPFEMREEGGRLYGRGTADMKGFIASALSLTPEFVAGIGRTPLHLAFSYDEEIGCLGVHSMVRHIAAHLPAPKAVIVGEPTMMRVVNSHKGIRTFTTEIIGVEAHSSTPHLGVNAIDAAVQLINFLHAMRTEMQHQGDASGRFDPPYTSIHVGTIEGGTALNIIPRRCRFQWEIRPLPDQDPDALAARFTAYAMQTVLPGLRAISPQANIIIRQRADVPPLAPREGSPAEALVTALRGSNILHAVSYTTEAGIFQDAGIPAVVCGPGDIEQAHKPDEFVAVAELNACDGFLRQLLVAIA
ncbi:MAG: acetylornithine deacetylase [Alphaproteobacteria bacterium]|nr:acetylornithine deacetylase [Alphaproteobacteria bacterium]